MTDTSKKNLSQNEKTRLVDPSHKNLQHPEDPNTFNALVKRDYNHPEQNIVKANTDESSAVFLNNESLETHEAIKKRLLTTADTELTKLVKLSPKSPKHSQDPSTLNDLVEIYYNRPKQGVVTTGIDESSAAFLGRVGLNTPLAVKKFLLTPAGKAVISEMKKELAVEQSFQEYRKFEQREHELLIRRIKIALFLSFLGRKAHASDNRKEWIRELNEKSLERQKVEPKATSSEEAQYKVNLQNLINNYTQAISWATAKKTALKNDEENILADLMTLEQQSERLLAKYSLYEMHINDDEFLSFLNANGLIDLENLELIHADLETRMTALYEKINGSVENNEDPTVLMQAQNALHLKFATLHDMLAVHHGAKYYADEQGKPVTDADGNTVPRMQDAAFILNKEDILLFENGQYYLLKPSQDWSTVKDNPEARLQALQQAKQNFDRSKTEIMTVKKAVNHNRGMEESVHNERINDKRFELALNAAEQRLAENQIRTLQSARSEAETALTAPTPSLRPSVSPTVTMQSTFHSTAPRPSPQSIPSYRKELEKLKEMRDLTMRDFSAFLNQVPTANQPHAYSFVQDFFKGGQMAAMSPLQKQKLLERLNQIAGTVQLDQLKSGSPTSTYQSPSPFNTSPNPYNKGG